MKSIRQKLCRILHNLGFLFVTTFLITTPTLAYTTHTDCRFKKVQKFISSKNPTLSSDTLDKISMIEIDNADKYNLDLGLTLAISAKESTFYPFSKSSDGTSIGLKMVNHKIWLNHFDINKQCLLDIECNVDIGNRILKEYIDKYGFINGIKRYRGSKKNSTNSSYLKKILQLKSEFEQQVGFQNLCYN